MFSKLRLLGGLLPLLCWDCCRCWVELAEEKPTAFLEFLELSRLWIEVFLVLFLS